MTSEPAGEAALARALAYARHGWPVFPCRPGRKEPDTAHGFKDATIDPGRITAWWSGNRTGIGALAADPVAGRDGDVVWQAAQRAARAGQAHCASLPQEHRNPAQQRPPAVT